MPYFAEKQQLADLNRENPLAWGGRVAEEYAALHEAYFSNLYSTLNFRKLFSVRRNRLETF